MSSLDTSLPTVSLVLPVVDGWERTFRCLMSLVQSSAGVRRETIVVDDGSADDTRLALPKLEGIAFVRNENAEGLARACNQAAARAQGDVLLFLDRDTVVEPGWLPPIAGLFQDPQVAAACPSATSGLQGAFIAVRASDLREAGGWDESRPDAADALLEGFLDAGRRVELVASAAMKLDAPPAPPPPVSP